MSTSTEEERAGRADRAGGTAGAGTLAARPTPRAALAIALVALWLTALFVGWVAGGLVHLLLAAALVAFPWRAAVAGEAASPFTAADDREPESKEER